MEPQCGPSRALVTHTEPAIRLSNPCFEGYFFTLDVFKVTAA
jgi:hypothetical protein